MKHAIVILLAMLVITTAAHADTPEDLIARGVELRRKGDNAAALELFRQAHTQAPSARTVGQMGLAEASLQKWVEADTHLSDALKRDEPWSRQTRAALETALLASRRHIGVLVLSGPAGSRVTINGRDIGTLPLDPLRLAEGVVTVDAQRPGYVPETATTTVTAADTVRVELQLSQAIVPPPTPTPPKLDPLRRPLPTKARWLRWTGAALIGAGAIGIGIGATWLALDGRPSCGPDCAVVYDTRTSGWISLGIGSAAALGGTILLFASRSSEVMLAASPHALLVAGRF